MTVQLSPDYNAVVYIYNMKVQLCCQLPLSTGLPETLFHFLCIYIYNDTLSFSLSVIAGSFNRMVEWIELVFGTKCNFGRFYTLLYETCITRIFNDHYVWVTICLILLLFEKQAALCPSCQPVNSIKVPKGLKSLLADKNTNGLEV